MMMSKKTDKAIADISERGEIRRMSFESEKKAHSRILQTKQTLLHQYSATLSLTENSRIGSYAHV
jgi:hypothetical protein